MDLVVTNSHNKTISILLGYGNGSFAAPITFPIGFLSYSIVSADFNGDNQADLAISSNEDNTVRILLGYGNGSFAPQRTFSIGYYSYTVAVGDFNSDNHIDIVVVNSNSETVSVLLGYGNGNFAAQRMFQTRSLPFGVAVSDFNGDKKTDIVVANRFNHTVSIFIGYGDGNFAPQVTFSTDNSPGWVSVGDFNNDNKTDLVVTNYNTVSVLLGYGNGSFGAPTAFSTDIFAQFVIVDDFNNDNQMDLVTVNYLNGTISVLLGYGNGSFAAQMSFSCGPYPYSIVAGDFNGDHRLDLAVTNNQNSRVSILLNKCQYPNRQENATTSSQILCSSAAWFPNATSIIKDMNTGPTASNLNGPTDILIDHEQNLIYGDIWKISLQKYFLNNNTQITMLTDVLPMGLFMDKFNNIYFSDRTCYCVKKVIDNGNGSWSTNVVAKYLNYPQGIYVDQDGTIYVADTHNNRIVKWYKDASIGIVVAGGNGQGNASNQLYYPWDIYVDEFDEIGAIYICDLWNHRIQKYLPGATAGITVAGGEPLNQLYIPHSLLFDHNTRTMYIADAGNARILRWPLGLQQGQVIVGGNGQGSQANQFWLAVDIRFDKNYNLYLADWGNWRIQMFLFNTSSCAN